MVALSTAAYAAEEPLTLVGTETTDATLTVGSRTTNIKARVSFALSATPAELQKGTLRVIQFNVLGLAVPQRELTGKEPRGKKTGPLGFAITPGPKKEFLSYDASRPGISGTLSGRVSFPQLEELFPPKPDPKTDVFTIPTQKAQLEVELTLERPIDAKAASDAIVKLRGRLEFSQTALADKELMLPRHMLNGRAARALLEVARRFEATRTLCLQPVAIRDDEDDDDPSGAGLEFGLPTAEAEWRKADIRYSVRPWMYVDNAAFRVASEGEMDNIRNSVSEDDCIEMFFTDAFQPSDNHGGGATYSSGTESAKIVSSDENLDGGINVHHLAHELGHVLSLNHPGRVDGGRPWMIPASTGTLMCPSGFELDNPDPNSQENKDSIQNPLLVASVGARGPNVDCVDSADCGDCPELPD
jgi:hypothetical protein